MFENPELFKEFPLESDSPRVHQWKNSHNAKVDAIAAAIANHDFNTLVSMITITSHCGKMTGKISLSTSVAINPFCAARRALDPLKYVCPHCFAAALSNMRITARLAWKRNSFILWNIVIPVQAWKTRKWTRKQLEALKTGFRIESTGDAANVMQCESYINLVKAFPEYKFTAWSKNYHIWAKAFKKCGKPENMQYIHSASMLNIQEKIPMEIIPFCDYEFTVYERQFAIEHAELKYNCCTPYQNRQCNRDCNECYCKGNDFHRREILR